MTVNFAKIKDLAFPILAIGGVGIGAYLLYQHQQAAQDDTKILPEFAFDTNPGAGWFGGGWGGGGDTGVPRPDPQPLPIHNPGPLPYGEHEPPGPQPVPPRGPVELPRLPIGGGSLGPITPDDYAFNRVLTRNTMSLGLAANGR